jgi:hypothetical protein
MAVKEALEEGLEFERAGDILVDFRELSCGELLPAGTDGGVVTEAAEEKLDFGKSEAHVGGEADEEHAVEGIGGIAALAANALGRSEEPAFFVVADGRGVEAGGRGELADFHEDLPEITLDLKLSLSFSIRGWDVASPKWRKP